MMISSKPIRDLIVELNEADETEHLEAKSLGAGKVGNSVFETICALSNEPGLSGGTILVGVEKELALFPQYIATGIENPDQISSDIANGCTSIFNFPIRVDISQEKIHGKVIIRVDVPELNASQKPVYFKKRGLPQGAFRRIGATDQRCTDDDLAALFQAKAQESYDAHIIESATWDDIDPGALAAYRKAREELNPFAEELRWNDQEMLHALNCISKSGEKENITATGLLVFGKATALRRISPSHRVDYMRVPGKEWVSDPDYELESIDMRGPILTIISRMIASIIDDLPRTFRVDEKSGKRIDIPVIPARVIREATVNAVMHRNYQTAQPIQILRYSNRLEIRNPGYSLKSQERFGEPGSALRNPHIAEILHETRYAETKGSGIRVMAETMAQHGLTMPTFSSNRDDDEFTAIFLFHHFLSEDDWAWLSKFSSLRINDDQMRALIFLREVGAIDNSAYRSLTHTDTLTASKSLRQLREMDIVDDRGSGSRTYYIPGRVMHEVEQTGGLGIHAKSPGIDAKSRQIGRAELPTALRLRVESLNRRVDPAVMEELIIDLCVWKPLSAEEIASILNKTSAYISNKYLYKMVKNGRLSYIYPTMVKHPGQKYTASEPSDTDG